MGRNRVCNSQVMQHKVILDAALADEDGEFNERGLYGEPRDTFPAVMLHKGTINPSREQGRQAGKYDTEIQRCHQAVTYLEEGHGQDFVLDFLSQGWLHFGRWWSEGYGTVSLDYLQNKYIPDLEERGNYYKLLGDVLDWATEWKLSVQEAALENHQCLDRIIDYDGAHTKFAMDFKKAFPNFDPNAEDLVNMGMWHPKKNPKWAALFASDGSSDDDNGIDSDEDEG